MKKNGLIISIISLCIVYSSLAQKKITIQYNEWNNYVKLPSNIQVGELVIIKCENIPEGKKLKGSIDYENRNMEDGQSFSGQMPQVTEDKKEKGNEVEDQKNKLNKEMDEIDKNSKMAINDEATSLKLVATNDKRYNCFLKTKINVDNLDKALEVGDVRNYLIYKNKMKKKTTEEQKLLDLAIKDLNWQTHLIDIAKDNFSKKLDESCKYIEFLESKIKKLEAYQPKETHDEYLQLRVKNFDNATIKLTIVDDQGKEDKKTSIDYRTRGGFKIDFSTGLVFHSLKDDNYKLIHSVLNDSINNIKDSVMIVEQPTSFANAGPTVMAHSYFRQSDNINLALTCGLAYNLQTTNLNYIAGGSLLLGHEQRFIFTMGAIMGKVNKLPKYYTVDKNYPQEQFNSLFTNDLKYETKWGVGFCVGMTYNLNLSNSLKSNHSL